MRGREAHLHFRICFARKSHESMTLIIRYASGTKYENFLGNYQEKSENKITGAIKLAKQSGKDVRGFDQPTFDLLMTGYFNMLGTVMLSEEDTDRIPDTMSDIAIVYKEGMIRLLWRQTGSRILWKQSMSTL